MKPNFEPAKRDATFIALPLIALFILKLVQGDALSMIELSDFSLATSIMYGQLLAKTLDVADKNKNKKKDKFSSYQVKIFVFSFLSIILYICLQLVDGVSKYIYWFQTVWFFVSLFLYVIYSTVIDDIKNG